MAVTSSANSNGWLARKHIDGVYIPAGLLIVGMAIVKFEWIFFSVAAAIILGGWKLFNSRKSLNTSLPKSHGCRSPFVFVGQTDYVLTMTYGP